ncbi:hypothetical protein THMIRHAS_10850 [Thiosulfatimonas sediminis]|uniref:CBS domain-containing protein n=1 Tax=Thiosulfatimonas sediminis TaxID=2675054 RepID=A0A6F8PU94_9GAMM|nr:CBS domain-containing protein [Thiosulfatimonas sediminis]BBP45712.1 hypothetical protein THMIRHAS_10850 [Thiosulfatimonas sediminis]
MFVVYSPEGQSLAASAQNLSMLRVDPSKRINKIEDAWLDELQPDEKSLLGQSSKALQAYQQNRKESQHRVVVKVLEIMSEPLISIHQQADLAQAFARMAEMKINYLPVLDDRRLIGLLTREQLLRKVLIGDDGALEFGGEKPVFEIMQRQVVTTDLSTDIRQVAQVFTQYNLGALVIMDAFKHPVGIVTRGDLIKRLAKEPPLELYV